MLPKKRRIERKYFPQILKLGSRFFSDSLQLYVLVNGQIEPHFLSKISFSVSKKVEKLATRRNKLRRAGYSEVEKYIKDIKDNTLLFFVFRKGLKDTNSIKINNEIGELLSKSFVIK